MTHIRHGGRSSSRVSSIHGLPRACGRAAHFESLFLVSNAAFAISVVLLYLIFLEFAQVEVAALLAATLALVPVYRVTAISPITDMTAFAFWCAALYGMLRYARNGDGLSLAVYTVAAVLMSLSRPIAYIPFFGGLGLAAFGLAFRDRTLLARGGILAFIAVVASLPPLLIAAQAHAPGFIPLMAQLRAMSAHPLGSLAQWYWHAVEITFAFTIVTVAISVVGPIAMVALLALPRRMESWILLAALFSTGLTVLINPIPSDVERVVILPMLPVVGCGLAASLCFGSRQFELTQPHEERG